MISAFQRINNRNGNAAGIAAVVIHATLSLSCGPGLFTLLDPTNTTSETLRYERSLLTFLQGETIQGISPVSALRGKTLTVSPSLPSGLVLNADTGAISGIPTAITALATYTVSTNDSEPQSVELQIRVIDGFRVGSAAMDSDALAGDGFCQTSSGECTLIAAIEEINAGTVKDVHLPAGAYTILSRPALRRTMAIYGDGQSLSILDGGGATALLQIDAITDNIPIVLGLHDLTFQNYNHVGGGGALSISGGITASITVNVTDATFKDGTVTGLGGAIYLGTYSTLNGTRIKVSGNSADQGGAIYVQSGALNLTDCLISGNSSATTTGGIVFAGGTGNVVDRCLLESNSGADGGAVNVNGANVDIKNSTLAFNSSNTGGAIHAASGTVTVTNATIAYNTVSGTNTGGGITGAGANLYVGNSIVHGNRDGSGATLDNCAGSVTSNGFNIENLNECNFADPDDTVLTDALIDSALADNGGFTRTLALSPASPAVNAGGSGCDAYDQRNLARDASCDIGAFELR